MYGDHYLAFMVPPPPDVPLPVAALGVLVDGAAVVGQEHSQ